jgi:hypothetical protein
MSKVARWLPVLLATACGPRLVDSVDTIEGSSESGEDPVPDLPPEIPACQEFGLTVPARVLSDDPSRYKVAGGIVTGPDELLAVWRRGFDGLDPDPNLMARRLDIQGNPIGASFALSDRNVTNGPLLRPSSDGHTLLTQCARFGYEDRAAPLRIDASGAVAQDMFIIAPESQHCGAHDPLGIWTGLRHLISWTDNSTYELRLALMDAEFGDRSTISLAPEGDLSAPPRFAQAPDGTLALVAGLRLGPIAIWLMTPDGELLGDATEVEFDIANEDPRGLAITPIASDGYVVWVAGRWEGGLYRIDLDADAEHLAGPTAVPGWSDWLLEDIDVVAAPGGHMLTFGTWDWENNFISWAFVDKGGVLGPPQEFADDFDEFYLATPRLNHLGGRVFMTYSASLGEFVDEFEIRMAEFGCVE